jgi:hypothetical protein
VDVLPSEDCCDALSWSSLNGTALLTEESGFQVTTLRLSYHGLSPADAGVTWSASALW